MLESTKQRSSTTRQMSWNDLQFCVVWFQRARPSSAVVVLVDGASDGSGYSIWNLIYYISHTEILAWPSQRKRIFHSLISPSTPKLFRRQKSAHSPNRFIDSLHYIRRGMLCKESINLCGKCALFCRRNSCAHICEGWSILVGHRGCSAYMM